MRKFLIMYGNEKDLEQVLKVARTIGLINNTREYGEYGNIDSYGYIYSTPTDKIFGPNKYRTIEKMLVDPTIAAILFAYDMTIRRTTWTTIPAATDNPKAQQYVEFYESILDDMSETFDNFTSQVLTFLAYGWSIFEKVLKIRRGPNQKKGEYRSKYNDGLYGIRKLGFRPQKTIERWEIDKNGNVLGVWQRTQTSPIFIPIEKLLIFRATGKGAPEGESPLAGAVEPWHYVKMVDKAEAYGIERELSGLPVLTVPMAVMEAAKEGNPDAVATMSEMKRIISQLRLNKMGGVILPSDSFPNFDQSPSSLPQFGLHLLSSGGQRSIDTSKVAERHRINIARVVLADFLMLGTGSKTGSQSLGNVRQDLFLMSADGFNEIIGDVFFKEIITPLGLLNGFDTDYLPKYQASPTKALTLDDIVKALAMYTSAGGTILPDERIDEWVKAKVNLPMGKSEEREEMEEQDERDFVRRTLNNNEEERDNSIGGDKRLKPGSQPANGTGIPFSPTMGVKDE